MTGEVTDIAMKPPWFVTYIETVIVIIIIIIIQVLCIQTRVSK